MGGQTVPPEKLRFRYYCSMQNPKAPSEILDEMYVYDNSASHHLVSASIHHAKYFSEDTQGWAKNI